jgi:hypothetical protein
LAEQVAVDSHFFAASLERCFFINDPRLLISLLPSLEGFEPAVHSRVEVEVQAQESVPIHLEGISRVETAQEHPAMASLPEVGIGSSDMPPLEERAPIERAIASQEPLSEQPAGEEERHLEPPPLVDQQAIVPEETSTPLPQSDETSQFLSPIEKLSDVEIPISAEEAVAATEVGNSPVELSQLRLSGDLIQAETITEKSVVAEEAAEPEEHGERHLAETVAPAAKTAPSAVDIAAKEELSLEALDDRAQLLVKYNQSLAECYSQLIERANTLRLLREKFPAQVNTMNEGLERLDPELQQKIHNGDSAFFDEHPERLEEARPIFELMYQVNMMVQEASAIPRAIDRLKINAKALRQQLALEWNYFVANRPKIEKCFPGFVIPPLPSQLATHEPDLNLALPEMPYGQSPLIEKRIGIVNIT